MSPEITKINILQDRFVVANTNDTIIVGDIETQKLSELMYFLIILFLIWKIIIIHY